MDRALFLAMSGAKQDMQAMQLRANNLANASTTGFRSDLEQARAMQAYGEGLPTRVFNMTERPGYSFAQGSTITTGRELDVAIKGDGWLAVLDGTGQEGYTRVGNLKVDQTGMLQNGHGHVILGERDAPIILPLPVSKIEIGTDGTVSVLPQARHRMRWNRLTASNWFVRTMVPCSKIKMACSNRSIRPQPMPRTQAYPC